MMFPAHLVLSLLQLWNQPVLQRSLVSFSGKWYLETSIWALGVLIVLLTATIALPVPSIDVLFASVWLDTLLTPLGLQNPA